MKTDKILAVGKEATLEINFQKAISYPPEIWVGICRKHYPNEDKIGRASCRERV